MRFENMSRSSLVEFVERTDTRHAPRGGWIKHTRQTLGVSAAWLATRLGISQSSVAALESNESTGAISLSSLRRAADALGYDVEYSFVPRVDPNAVRAAQATRAARAIVNRVAHSMALEDQAVSHERTEALVQMLAVEMLESGTRRIWDVDADLP
jgi:predicted DNA-binding mobile mystery protein A